MTPKHLFSALAVLTIGAANVAPAQAQEVLSAEEVAQCELLLASLDPSAEPTAEQAACIALLAQLGVQPALGEDDDDNDEEDRPRPDGSPS
jgi:hypothetical protein